MSYTNKVGQNPLKLSNDIEIRSGTSATAEAVSDEYRDTLGYEPGIGSMYQSTGGQVFVHNKAGQQANDWSLITDVQQTDLESFSASIGLAVNAPEFSINKFRAATISLASSIIQAMVISAKSVSLSLASAIARAVTKTKSAGMSLGAEIAIVFENLHEIITVIVSLTPSITKSMVKVPFGVGASLGADVAITFNPA